MYLSSNKQEMVDQKCPGGELPYERGGDARRSF